MKYTCPECNTKDIGESDVCDNDCKTIICEECGAEFYFDKDNKLINDHDPECGIHEDPDLDDAEDIEDGGEDETKD